MAKVLILYYSAYGHIERMPEAVAEGVRQAGAEAVIKRVPELVPEEIARKSGFKLDQKAPNPTALRPSRAETVAASHHRSNGMAHVTRAAM